MRRENVVWLSPSATTFSCLCELCLERGRAVGQPFLESVRAARVQGRVSVEADVAVVRCAAGHAIVARRARRPPSLEHVDERQLQLA